MRDKYSKKLTRTSTINSLIKNPKFIEKENLFLTTPRLNCRSEKQRGPKRADFADSKRGTVLAVFYVSCHARRRRAVFAEITKRKKNKGKRQPVKLK